jgi:hypothetical protein
MATTIYLADGYSLTVAPDPSNVHDVLAPLGGGDPVMFTDVEGQEVWVNPAQVTRFVEEPARRQSRDW